MSSASKTLEQTTSGQSATYLSRAYALKDTNDAKTLYEEWASTYDQHLQEASYASPNLAVAAVIKHIDNDLGTLKILDAGCGTGLVGEVLSKSQLNNRFVLDGLDLTPGMLKVAKQKGVYRDLEVADLTGPIERTDGSYHVLICVGTLTKGHVGPGVLNEFARVVAHGGLIVATVHEEVWESGGYKSVVDGLARQEIVEVIGTEGFGIVDGSESGGRMVVLRKR